MVTDWGLTCHKLVTDMTGGVKVMRLNLNWPNRKWRRSAQFRTHVHGEQTRLGVVMEPRWHWVSCRNPESALTTFWALLFCLFVFLSSPSFGTKFIDLFKFSIILFLILHLVWFSFSKLDLSLGVAVFPAAASGCRRIPLVLRRENVNLTCIYWTIPKSKTPVPRRNGSDRLMLFS